MTGSTILLQGIAALTFGLAIAGIWRAFGRPSAAVWAVAMVAHGSGSILAAVVFGLNGHRGGPDAFAILIAFPAMALLFAGIGLFRLGTAVLVGRPLARAAMLARGGGWAAGGLALVVAVGLATRTGNVDLGEFLLTVGSRVAMAVGCFVAMAPLWRSGRPDRRVEFALLGSALAASGVRFLVAAAVAYESLASGPVRPDPVALQIAHMTILIFLGVATTLALVGEERVAAREAARTISETAEALRRAEGQLRFVIEHSSDVPLVVGPDRQIEFIGPSAERLLGFRSTELQGLDLLNLAHPDDRAPAAAAILRLLGGGPELGSPLAVRVRHRGGEWVPFEVRGRRVVDSAGRPTLVLSARDVTVQRRLEGALIQSQKVEALGQMAAGVAHDFNNILTAITAATSFARGTLPPDSPAVVDLNEISRAAERGAALTRQLLTYARRQAIAPEQFSVRARVAALEGLLRRLVGMSVDLTVVAGSDDLFVHADPSQFDQVVVNLAANARDAMPKGGNLTLRLGQVAGAARDGTTSGPLVRVEVEDTGGGMPIDVLPRVFEPFFTTKGEHGTGLGLATAFGFARQAGGDLRVENTAAGGALFTLELPMVSTE